MLALTSFKKKGGFVMKQLVKWLEQIEYRMEVDDEGGMRHLLCLR